MAATFLIICSGGWTSRNGELDTAKQRWPGSASGDWLADGLVAALRLRSYTVDYLIAADQIYELSRSNDTQMILISNGAHHVAVRRFVTGGPLIFFDSIQDRPIVVRNDFWQVLRENNEEANQIKVYLVHSTELHVQSSTGVYA